MYGISSSQTSNASIPELDLSQDTMNQIMGAVGLRGTGDIFSNCYSHEEDTSEEPLVESSSISVRRAVISHTEGQVPNVLSQQTGHMSPLVGSTATVPVVSSSFGNTSLPYYQAPSPEFSARQSLSSPPFSSTLSPECSPGPAENGLFRKCATPLNEPMEGQYGFRLELPRDGTKNFLYSEITKRAYIKMGAPVQFNFSVTASPPEDAFLRVMAIHSAPENMAENLICCAKHVDANKKKGLLFPEYFVRPFSDEQRQFCVHYSGRLSVTTPISTLQRVSKAGTMMDLISLYTFPCFTSDFGKTAQHVQLIFTLEQGVATVLGRCSLDVRICCSTSRDRDNDEKKRSSLDPDDKEIQRAGKRGATELTTCVLPAKRVCQRLSGKRKYTIETYPEVFPYVEVCIKMMEKVHQFPHTVDTGASRTEASTPQLESLEAWLAHLGLIRYSTVLEKKGISELCQVLSVTEEDLKNWGVRNKSHRKAFLEGKELIHVADSKEDSKNESTELFSSSQTFTSSQTSTGGGIQRTQSFEVLEITMKKSLSSSSDSS